MDKLRLFVAIRPPAPALDRIAEVQQELRNFIGERAVRWVNVANLHITLYFLGDAPAAAIAPAGEALERAAEAAGGGDGPLEVATTVTGAFPNARRARVLWLGMDDRANALAQLAQRVRRELNRRDLHGDDKPFRPHITLGYVRRNAPRDAQAEIAAALQRVSPAPVTFAASEMLLVESTLQPGGSVYVDRYSVSLPGTNDATSSAESARE
jgi:2'-5' RNA ligase